MSPRALPGRHERKHYRFDDDGSLLIYPLKLIGCCAAQSIAAMIREAIAGKRVLIVEDEPLVAMHLEDTLSNMGCELVGSARSAAQAIRLLDSEPVDFAVLDINLGRAETSYSVADVLAARGIPFTFLTGYSEAAVAAPYRDRPRLQKPFGEASLMQALAKAFPRL